MKNIEKRFRSSANAKKSNWVEIKNGFLKIGHKPLGKRISIESLLEDKTDTVLTILSEREGAIAIGEKCKLVGINWLWLPLSDGKIPPYSMKQKIIELFVVVKEKLIDGKRIFIHCSAGLHRTGMLSHAFLLFLGFDTETAFSILEQLRPITAHEVGEHRLLWGKQFQS